FKDALNDLKLISANLNEKSAIL
ncbi:hypothetical protein JL09_g6660, partial [Pichia kudriavzevii]